MARFQYKHYLLILLTVVATLNYVDRFVLSLVLEPIKQEFGLTDSQLGLMSGFAFASFYALAGIPIARWADRGNRNIIVTLTTGLWSIMLVLSGMVGNFTQLLVSRVGVAVGEAGCLPPANSLIADYFDRAERPRAMATYWLCGSLALIVGYLGGGWLVANYGWRLSFIIIGVPGLFLAALVKFTLREPRLKKNICVVESQPTFKSILVSAWQQRALRHIIMGFIVAYFFSMGFVQWLPTFFMRSYGMDSAHVGAWFAVSWGGFGLIGTYLGGHVTERYAAHKEALQMRCIGVGFAVVGLSYVAVFLSENYYQALAGMSLAAFIGGMANGPVFSAIQSLVNNKMRSVMLALIFLLANFIGLGLGPVATGALSDLFASSYGQESLRYALAAFAPGLVWVSYFYWKASQTIESDIEAIEAQSDMPADSSANNHQESNPAPKVDTGLPVSDL
ncbi:MFS transporter [Porticoccaceae bacterium]|nr:MFS transporter [Porticoccaceae bacterium]